MTYADKHILEGLGYSFDVRNSMPGVQVTFPEGTFEDYDCVDHAIAGSFEHALQRGTYPWVEFLDQQSGIVLKRERFYGFGDAGGIAGGGEGHASPVLAVAAVRAEGNEDIGTHEADLGDNAVCVLSGDQYVRRIATLGDDVEEMYGKFGTQHERYEQALGEMCRDVDQEPLSLDEVAALGDDYGLDDEYKNLLLAAAQQPLGQPSPPLKGVHEVEFVPTDDAEDDEPVSAGVAFRISFSAPSAVGAIFAVLTLDQQRRVLESLGWRTV